jgi:predicted phage-related endonuclease
VIVPNRWESRRGRVVGGTDAAAIAGLSRYADAFDVWLRLKGRAEPLEETTPMRWGTRLEPAIRTAFEEDTGRRLCLYGRGRLDLAAMRERVDVEQVPRASGELALFLTDRERRYRCGTPDDFVEQYLGPAPGEEPLPDDVAQGPGVFDAKTSAHPHPDWETGVPLYERAQVEWYLGLTGCRWGSLALFRGTLEPLLVRDFAASPELFGLMSEAVDRFWHDHVLRDVPPDVTRSGDDLDRWIAATYPVDDGSSIVLPARFADVERRRRDALARAKAADAEARELARELKTAMGAAKTATIAGSDLRLRWTTVRRAGYTVPPTSYRDFRGSGGDSGA